tara:strand:- start:593 stop:1408 length:816 start_codon:yes stop_codon:yes gene_type:complete
MSIKTIIFFSFAYVAVSVSYASDIYKNFQNANDLIISENYSEAKKILLKIKESKPNNYQIVNNLAYIEAKQGDIDKAIKILRRSISRNKDIDIIYNNLTNLYAFQANILYEEALSIKDTAKNKVILSLANNLDPEFSKSTDIIKEKVSDVRKSNQNNIQIEDLENFIYEWASFWQNKNYQEYFNCYADQYFPKKFKSRSAWMSDRKEKIQNKKNIEIKISSAEVFGFNNKVALISFTQAYNSDSFSDVVKKHALISLVNNTIKITGEYILK